MLNYAVVEIAGRQYKVKPNQAVVVNFLGNQQSLECDKVILLQEGSELKIGDPYLKQKLTFTVLAGKQKKIRVATYHAKANTRKVTGSKQAVSIIKLKTAVREKS